MRNEQSSGAIGNQALLAALINLPVTLVWVIVLASLFSGWVGASHKPIPIAMVLGLLPSVICFVLGVCTFVVGFHKKTWYAMICGSLSIVSGIVGFIFAYFEIMMLSIG
jgi:hypothetical protein